MAKAIVFLLLAAIVLCQNQERKCAKCKTDLLPMAFSIKCNHYFHVHCANFTGAVVTCPECGTEVGEDHLIPHHIWVQQAATLADMTPYMNDCIKEAVGMACGEGEEFYISKRKFGCCRALDDPVSLAPPSPPPAPVVVVQGRRSPVVVSLAQDSFVTPGVENFVMIRKTLETEGESTWQRCDSSDERFTITEAGEYIVRAKTQIQIEGGVYLSSESSEVALVLPGVEINIIEPVDNSFVIDDDARVSLRVRNVNLPQDGLLEVLINGNRGLLLDRLESEVISFPITKLPEGYYAIEVRLVRVHDQVPLGPRAVSSFSQGKDFSWVKYHTQAAGDGLRECEAGKYCRIEITANPVDGMGEWLAQNAGHYFEARLMGPSIVSPAVHDDGNGKYTAEYMTFEPGEYSLEILLIFASGSGYVDPGQGVPRLFINRHVRGSPFKVTIRPLESLDEQGTIKALQNTSVCHKSQVGNQQGRWVSNDVCEKYDNYCGGVNSTRFDLDSYTWVPFACVLRPYTAEDYNQCLEKRGPNTKLTLSGTSLSRTSYYDIVLLFDPTINTTKEWEDMEYEGPPFIGFHWVARNPDHIAFEGDLLPSEEHTGRLKYNMTINHFVTAMEKYHNQSKDVLVVACTIFDILKSPLEDYEANMLLMRDMLKKFPGEVIWRTGEAIHDRVLDAQWDFTNRAGRYMNGPRVVRANEIATKIMQEAGFRIFDPWLMTIGRIEKAEPDGNHYWKMTNYPAQRRGNAVANTIAQTILNMMCNGD